jgi:hypothetical protein
MEVLDLASLGRFYELTGGPLSPVGAFTWHCSLRRESDCGTKGWAEWFTTIITSSPVPLEIYEIAHHPTVTEVIVLLLNLVIIAYLIKRIRKERFSQNTYR